MSIHVHVVDVQHVRDQLFTNHSIYRAAWLEPIPLML